MERKTQHHPNVEGKNVKRLHQEAEIRAGLPENALMLRVAEQTQSLDLASGPLSADGHIDLLMPIDEIPVDFLHGEGAEL